MVTNSMVARRVIAGMLVGALVFAGCGSSEPDAQNATATPATGTLEHVDGTIAVDGETLTVTPRGSTTGEELEIGSAVQPAELQAMAASGEVARVYHRDGMAVRVQAASTGQTGETIEGTVTEVTDTTFTLDSGTTFAIESSEAVDIDHLEEHRENGEPVRVWYTGELDADPVATAYEDAAAGQ